MYKPYLNDEKIELIESKWGASHLEYIYRIEETINKARKEYPRLLVVRIDLRFPLHADSSVKMDRLAITRMFKSLGEKLLADGKRKKRRGLQVYRCRLRYIWVREFKKEDDNRKHYHVLLLLNKDAYHHPGDFTRKGTLAYMIKSAWCCAINVSCEKSEGLVELPTNCSYWIKRGDERELKTFDDVMFRTAYFAKMATKKYGDGERNFGCSQN